MGRVVEIMFAEPSGKSGRYLGWRNTLNAMPKPRGPAWKNTIRSRGFGLQGVSPLQKEESNASPSFIKRGKSTSNLFWRSPPAHRPLQKRLNRRLWGRSDTVLLSLWA